MLAFHAPFAGVRGVVGADLPLYSSYPLGPCRPPCLPGGSSFLGSHAYHIDNPAHTLVPQVPHLDGMENAKANLRTRGLPAVLRLLAAAAHDKLRAAAATGLDRLEAALAPPATASTAPVTKAKAAASDSPAAAVERLLAALRPAAAEAVSWLRAAAAPLLTPAYVKLLGAPGELALMQLQPAEIAAYFSKHPKEYQVGAVRMCAVWGRAACTGRDICMLHKLVPSPPLGGLGHPVQ